VPEPADTAAILNVQARPTLGEIVVVKLVAPVNSFNADTVMVELPLTPEFTLTVVGLADIVKSWKLKVAVAE
jgi:hypothetical protein